MQLTRTKNGGGEMEQGLGLLLGALGAGGGGELYFVFLALCLSLLGATWLLKLLLSSCQALSSLFANKS